MSVMALLLPRLAVDAIGAVRLGSVTGASSFWCVQVGGGAAWRMLVFPTRQPVEVDLRADMLAMFLVATHGAEAKSTWLPAARVALEGVWFPSNARVGILVLAGPEAAFGSATVYVGTKAVATVPPLRAVGELGLRARF